MTPLKKFIVNFILAIVLTAITVLVTADVPLWLLLIMEAVHVGFLVLPLLFGALRYGGFVASHNSFYIFISAATFGWGCSLLCCGYQIGLPPISL